MKLKNNRYWVCIIGSPDNKEIPDGGDYPMRIAVENAFKKLIGRDDDIAWSGWGVDEGKKDIINAVWSMGKNDPLYIAIESMLKGASRIKSSELLGNVEN